MVLYVLALGMSFIHGRRAILLVAAKGGPASPALASSVRPYRRDRRPRQSFVSHPAPCPPVACDRQHRPPCLLMPAAVPVAYRPVVPAPCCRATVVCPSVLVVASL